MWCLGTSWRAANPLGIWPSTMFQGSHREEGDPTTTCGLGATGAFPALSENWCTNISFKPTKKSGRHDAGPKYRNKLMSTRKLLVHCLSWGHADNPTVLGKERPDHTQLHSLIPSFIYFFIHLINIYWVALASWCWEHKTWSMISIYKYLK